MTLHESDHQLRDLTIVIPAYKCAKFLPATVESALRCPESPILVAVNLGDDETVNAAKDCAARAPDRIKLLENETNLGMTGNWQRAFQQVKTPFALNLSADDLISAIYLREALQLLSENPRVGMASGLAREVGEDFALTGPPPPDLEVRRENFRILHGVDIARFALVWSPYATASSTIYRMEAWNSIGGFDLHLNWCCDRDMWFRIGQHFDAALCDVPAVYYRLHETSVTGQTRRADQFCFELSDMFRRARHDWPSSELTPLFHSVFRNTTKAFFGSSRRAVTNGKIGDAFRRSARGFGEAWRIFA